MRIMTKQNKKKVGLALGGGATFGAAHIGVLKALDEMSIDIHCISGTSIGAYVAALYAFGVAPSKIEQEVTGLDWLDITSFSLLKLKFGLLTNEVLGNSINKLIGDVAIQESNVPLAIVATDIGECKKLVLTEGNVAMAVMASSCVPGIFSPIKIDGRMVVDGGLVENVPVSPLNELGADFMIAVDLSRGRSYRKPDDIVDVLINSIDLAIDNATRLQTSKADLVISPKLSAYSRSDTGKTAKLIEEGYERARRELSDSSLATCD